MSIIVRSNEKAAPETQATKEAEVKEAAPSADATPSAPEAKTSEQKESTDSVSEEAEEKQESESEEKEVEETSESTEEPKDEKPKKKSGFQRRVDKLNQRITAREQEVEYWKQQALTASGSKTEAKVETKQEASEGKPKPEDFESHAAYVEALTDWKVDKREEAREQKEQKKRFEAEQANLISSHQKRVDAFRSSHDDFDEKLEGLSDVPRSPAVEQVIVSSENGPAILYELAKNPSEAIRIAKLSPIAAALEMGKIEARISSKSSSESKTESKKITNAPSPLKPVNAGGKGSVPKSIFDPDLSQAEYERLRNEQLKKRRQA